MVTVVRYMAFVKDIIYPSQAYVDTTWLTENGHNWETEKTRDPCNVLLTCIFEKMEIELM